MAAKSVSIRLGGASYRLAPTYGAMSAIEERLNVSCGQLYGLLSSGGLRIDEAAVIVTEGARASGEDFSPEDVAKRLYEEGLYEEAPQKALASYLTALMWQPATAKKKIEVLFSRLTSESGPSAEEIPSPEDTSGTSSPPPPGRPSRGRRATS